MIGGSEPEGFTVERDTGRGGFSPTRWVWFFRSGLKSVFWFCFVRSVYGHSHSSRVDLWFVRLWDSLSARVHVCVCVCVCVYVCVLRAGWCAFVRVRKRSPDRVVWRSVLW